MCTILSSAYYIAIPELYDVSGSGGLLLHQFSTLNEHLNVVLVIIVKCVL
jgi:hypothetical protein